MRIVYGANASPFVRKVRVALAEKGLDYELEPVFPFNVSADFKKLSPLGKIPAFRDGDHVLADSSVICAYLERRHPTPALYPADPYQYARALWFEEYGDSALVAVTGAKIFFKKIVGPLFMNQPLDQAGIDQAVAEDLPPLFDYLDSQLPEGGMFAGKDLSIGDIGIATQLVNLMHAGYGVDGQRWPKLADWVGRVHGRPSFRRLIDEEAPQFRG